MGSRGVYVKDPGVVATKVGYANGTKAHQAMRMYVPEQQGMQRYAM